MRKLIVIAVAILLGAASINAAEVETISLRYVPNQTIATIHVNGQVRVTHQTEIPKDGKGHRVIIDLLAATHNLGSNNFDNLPNCMISSIRSSQFAVSPEQITRVVFDVDRAPIYRIETDQQSVTVYFTDRDVKQFASWNSKVAETKSTTPVKPRVVATKSENQVKPTTVASAPVKSTPTATESTPAPVKSQPVPDKPKPAVVASTSSAKVNIESTKPAVKQTTEQPKPTPVVAKVTQPKAEKNQPVPAKPAPIVAQKPKADSKQSSEHRPVVVVADNQSKAPETTLVAERPKQMPLKSEMKPAENSSSTTPDKKKGQSALANKISGQESTPAKTVAQATKPEPKATSTSRFRRNPGQSGISGTMVVEFPKRLVIKYKGNKYRDPFETLINAQKSTDNPIEKRVPNIDGLRLVGVIEADSKNDRALFEDTDGFGYILKSGDKVRNGYVLRVESDRVYFQIFEYGWSRTVALQLED